MRKLNKITVFDPEPSQFFQKVIDDKFSSKVVLSKGYWQIKVLEEDIPKTAFETPDGHWEFLRMPFGMVSSGSTLKRRMNRTIGDIDNAFFSTGTTFWPTRKTRVITEDLAAPIPTTSSSKVHSPIQQVHPRDK